MFFKFYLKIPPNAQASMELPKTGKKSMKNKVIFFTVLLLQFVIVYSVATSVLPKGSKESIHVKKNKVVFFIVLLLQFLFVFSAAALVLPKSGIESIHIKKNKVIFFIVLLLQFLIVFSVTGSVLPKSGKESIHIQINESLFLFFSYSIFNCLSGTCVSATSEWQRVHTYTDK